MGYLWVSKIQCQKKKTAHDTVNLKTKSLNAEISNKKDTLIGLGQNKNFFKNWKKTQKSLKKSQQESENIYKKTVSNTIILKHHISNTIICWNLWDTVEDIFSGHLMALNTLIRVSLVSQLVKKLPAMQRTGVWSLGQEYSLDKGMATHSSFLTWIISWTEKSGGLQFMDCQESDMTERLTKTLTLGKINGWKLIRTHLN